MDVSTMYKTLKIKLAKNVIWVHGGGSLSSAYILGLLTMF